MTYLVITLEGREICRALIKKESMEDSCSKENANASDIDGDCIFSGPSKTFNPEKIVREKKSRLNYELFDKEVPKLKHKKSSVQKRQSNKAEITIDKEKVEWLKFSRDYSFLLSDNDELHGSGVKLNPWIVKNVSKSCDSMPKKKSEVSRREAATPKPKVLSSKPWSKESRFKNSGRSNFEGHVRKRKQVIYEDEDDDDDQAIDTHKEDTRRTPGLLRKKIVEQEKRETKKRKMY
ncbi:unnamed protein product [Fraxinus pennsylvanica]|uniref:Uncharacterized protein n=1 Tax=Fraxinus pennsylvanica TaxID=56036 RepID=A0AAD2DIK2_9LAMI|nr:unnamed protein product [Fraxinus pennsylvanica]